MVKRPSMAPTTVSRLAAAADPSKTKEAKWAAQKEHQLQELEKMVAEGWILVYIDGSANRVRD